MRHHPLLLALLGVSACTFEIKVDLPESEMSDDGEDGGTDRARDGGDGQEGGHAGEYDASRDGDGALAGDASGDGGSDGLAGTIHPACSVPRGTSLPPVVGVHGDASGRPAFDFWRDLGCESVADYPTCEVPRQVTALGDWHCYKCSYRTGTGICSADDSTRCATSGNELLTLGEGRCHLCAPVEAKARACCAELPDIDCRAWPYPANSKPGEGCARHDDCEPGLVCRVLADQGYGLCVCPDASLPSEAGVNDCGSST
jgi:hypothetical protein